MTRAELVTHYEWLRGNPLMSPEEAATMVREEGPGFVAWEFFYRWGRKWMDDHPDDCRYALELIDVFSEEMNRDAREREGNS